MRCAPGAAFGKSGESEVSLVDFHGPRHGLAGTSGTRTIAIPPVGTVVDFDERGASSVKQLATRLARNPLVQNAAALYGVQLVRKVLPLIIVPYLARTLGASGWGVVAFTLSMAELIVLLIEFGFNLSATREVARARDSGEGYGAIMSGVLGAQALLATAGVLCAIVVSRFIPLLRDQPKLLAAGLFYAIAQGFIPLWFFQGLERMRLAATIEACGRIAGLVCIFLLVRSPQDAWLALLLQGAAPAFTTFLRNSEIRSTSESIIDLSTSAERR
jgi:PST family polysaccharide transporter